MRDILLVHSNDKLSDLYHKRLTEHFRVKRAVDALSGIREIRSAAPHMVVSEYDLPWVSGLALLKFVRKHPPTLSIPVVFLSHRDAVPEALDHGANEWIRTNEKTLDEVMDKIIYHLLINRIKH